MMRAVMVVVGVVAAAIVLGVLWLDKGEVVTLLTTDAESNIHDTQLWTVEIDGVRYLRASSAGVAWLARVRAHPGVALDLGGLSVKYRATALVDRELRERVNQAMALKYGFVDRVWGAWSDRGASIPIRLDVSEALVSGRGESS
jgi:hypothetical protein